MDGLWDLFENCDAAVKGDIIYLAGEIGAADQIDALNLIACGKNTLELKEAAREAIDTLKSRFGI